MEPYVVETILNVRYAETDAMGMVHHSAYSVWFEEGRGAWFRERLKDPRGYARFEEDGYFLAVTDLAVRFVAPARYGDQVKVRTWITAVRSRGITVSYEVLNAKTGNLLVKGHTSHICLDKHGNVSVFPQQWTAKFLST